MLKKASIISLFIVPLIVIAVMALSKSSLKNYSSSPLKLKIENFTLTDIYNKKHSLSEYDNSKAILIIFIATQCPVSNSYNSRMVELYNNYSNKNIALIGINSNKQESINECKSHAEKNGFNFTVLKDEKNIIADMFEASVTPEAYVLEPKTYTILYHGRIDDSKNEKNVETKDLENALNEILAGKMSRTLKQKLSAAQLKEYKYRMKLFIPLLFSLIFFSGCIKEESRDKDIEQTISRNNEIKVINEEWLKNKIGNRNGKILFINFWATWCVPCIEEFPDLVKIYNENKNSDFEFLSVSVDLPSDIESKVKPFLAKQSADFPDCCGRRKKKRENY